MNNSLCLRLLLLIVLAPALLSCAAQPAGRPGTREDRLALLDYLLEKTMERTAWSAYTAGQPELHFREEAGKLREEFGSADTDDKLFRALVKLSNLRHDRHLDVSTVTDGLQPTKLELRAPLQFRTDYGTPGEHTLFVADFDRKIAELGGAQPEVGDVLMAVNGMPTAEYARMLEPWIRYSTVPKLWWEIAVAVTAKTGTRDPQLYRDRLECELRRPTGETYELSLPYLDPKEINWAGLATKIYPGYRQVLETGTYTLYLAAGGRKTILLDWKGFQQGAPKDTDQLISYAQEQGLLAHDIIFDGTSSRGGSRGAYVLSRLSPRPFHTTMGNLRLSDVTVPFIDSVRANQAEGETTGDSGDRGRRLLEWLETDVMAAYKKGERYSPNVPFKLADLPKGPNVMQPAPVHFTGRLVCLMGPSGGSHLDQFMAMVVDNKLGYSIGLPAGGYSNTWEWEEDLKFPISGKPVARFMWNIGHTIRPNGEILEGNAAQVDETLPTTRANFRNYYSILLERAHAWLDK